MIRRVVCAFKGHDDVGVSPGGAGMFVMPTVGLVCQYVEDENGDFRACRRCRRVSLARVEVSPTHDRDAK